MPSQDYNTIKQAIKQKQQITATYDGHYREMCPHTIGTKNGREQALFYQFAGSSSSGSNFIPGSSENWRCMPIGGLTNVSVRDGDWHTVKNGHSQPQECIDNIDAEVSY